MKFFLYKLKHGNALWFEGWYNSPLNTSRRERQWIRLERTYRMLNSKTSN
jgi:hypothetical protein